MNYLLNAKHIGVEDDGYVLVLGFSDDEIEPRKYVLLQRTLEPDEQDKNLGMDKAHIQIEDESRSGYGGISSMQYLRGNELRIALTPKGKEFLRVDGEIIITFPDDNAITANALEKLAAIAKDDFIVVPSA